MSQRTMCVVGGFLALVLVAALDAVQVHAAEPKTSEAPAPTVTNPAAAPQPTAPKLAPPKQALATQPAASPTAGTYIHVKNGTNRSLNFSLYVDCAGEGTGKFDREFHLEPGEIGIWRLSHTHKVAMTNSNGAKLYRLGLVGTDAQGLRHHWGTLGGTGMVGNEQTKTVADATKPVSYRHILVRPAGEFK